MRWLRALGWFIAVAGTVLASAKTIVDWLGRFDFIIAHRAEPGWIGGAVEYVTAPPWWLPWCVLAFGLVLIWADSRRRVKAPHNATVNRPQEQSPNIVFECHLAELPTKVPPEGHIYTLPLFYSPDAGILRPISLSTIHGQPGSNFVWFSDLKFPQVYRCEITNYGSAPLLQVTLNFKVEYRDDSHNLVHSYEWPVLLSKIDPGNSNAATFYVYNQSRYHAHVNPPDTASYFVLAWSLECHSGQWRK